MSDPIYGFDPAHGYIEKRADLVSVDGGKTYKTPEQILEDQEETIIDTALRLPNSNIFKWLILKSYE